MTAWTRTSDDRFDRTDRSNVTMTSRGRWNAYVTGPNDDGGAPLRKALGRGVRCAPALLSWKTAEEAMAAVDARKPLQVDGLCPARFGDQSCGYQPGAGESCDKRLVTCRNFGNVANYQGTPKIPLA